MLEKNVVALDAKEHIVEKLVCKKTNNSIVDFILKEFSELSYGTIQKLLRKKDIKLNGQRIKADCAINAGDQVEIFLPQKAQQNIEVIYSDEFMVIANKPSGIEVIAENADCLLNRLTEQTGKTLYAVHRIDRNTTGLVVFAANLQAKAELEQAFKQHLIEKYYLAVVVGKPVKEQDKLVAYHKKDSKKAMCYISDEQKNGYTKIITSYKVLKSNDILSLLEVQIETGKTHQIRAHLSHIGYPILGDEKYGDKQSNKQHKKKKQMLVAYKLNFGKRIKGAKITNVELKNTKQELLNTL